MNLSWSQNIFIAVNTYIGKKPALDKLMCFWAVWGIYVLIACIIGSAVLLFPKGGLALLVFLLSACASFGIGLGIDAMLGILRPRKRPKDALPGTIELIHLKPFEYWKSFPSDHTMAAFTFVFITMLFGLPLVRAAALLFLAFLIAIARVYVGVHFPRDIIGGIVVAGVTTGLVWVLLPFFLKGVL